MISDVVLEGIAVRTWKYTNDLLFSLACYCDPNLPQKPLNEVHDAADFVTIRVPKGNLGAPVVVEKNYHLRVHRFLQSRDYEESLADFLKDARGIELPVPENLNLSEVRAPRDTTEVVARRIKSQVNISQR